MSDGERYHAWRKSRLKLEDTVDEEIYPHKFSTTTSPFHFIEKYNHLNNEQVLLNIEAVAGRIHHIRSISKNLKFLDLIGNGYKLQVRFNF